MLQFCPLRSWLVIFICCFQEEFSECNSLGSKPSGIVKLDDFIASPYTYGRRIIFTGLPKRVREFSILPSISKEYVIPEMPSPKVGDSPTLLSTEDQYTTFNASLTTAGNCGYSALFPSKIYSLGDSVCSFSKNPDKISDNISTSIPSLRDIGTQTKWNLMCWKDTKSFDTVSFNSFFFFWILFQRGNWLGEYYL